MGKLKFALLSLVSMLVNNAVSVATKNALFLAKQGVFAATGKTATPLLLHVFAAKGHHS